MTWPINPKYQMDECLTLIDTGRMVSMDNLQAVSEMIGAVLAFHDSDRAVVKIDFESVGIRITVVPTDIVTMHEDNLFFDELPSILLSAKDLDFSTINLVVSNDGRFSTSIETYLSHLVAAKGKNR